MKETDTKLAVLMADKGFYPPHLQAQLSRVISSSSWTMLDAVLLGKTLLFLTNKNQVICFNVFALCIYLLYFSFPKASWKCKWCLPGYYMYCSSMRIAFGTEVKATGEWEYLRFCLQGRDFFVFTPLFWKEQHRDATEKSEEKRDLAGRE